MAWRFLEKWHVALDKACSCLPSSFALSKPVTSVLRASQNCMPSWSLYFTGCTCLGPKLWKWQCDWRANAENESPSAVHAGCAGGESYWQQGPGVPGRGASGSCSRGLERTRPSIELPPFFSCCLTLRKISKWWIGGSFWPAVSPAQAGWFGFSQKRSSRMGLLPGTRRG